MKFKKEYLILTVIIVAALLYLFFSSADRGEKTLQLPKIEAEKIDRLIVKFREKEPLTLAKKEERWQIEPKHYTADQNNVDRMLQVIVNLKLTAMVSESENYERYGLLPKERIIIEAYSAGKLVRSLTLGKTAPTNQHTFVLVEKDPRVYHARGQLDPVFEQSVENLRDKNILSLDKAGITEIAVAKGDRSLALVRKKEPEKKADDNTPASAEDAKKKTVKTPEPKWATASGQAVDQVIMERLLEPLFPLYCEGYLEDEDPAKLQKPSLKITLKDAKGDYSLTIFRPREKGEKIPAVSSTTPFPFYLNNAKMEGLEKTIDELLGMEKKSAAAKAGR